MRAGHVKNRRAAKLPESTVFAETHNCRIDHSLYKLSEGGTFRHTAGGIDSDVVSGHHPSDVCRLADVTDRHVQVRRNGFVNKTQQFRFVSYNRGHFVSPLKRQSQNTSAAIASCAKEKDFHGDPPDRPQ
jgi:hypothetical protein